MNGIDIPTPIAKTPYFNYVSFIKVLSFPNIGQIIEVLMDQRNNISQSLDYNEHLVSQELLKVLMKHFSCIKTLDYCTETSRITQNIPFTYFPGATECLADVTTLNCDSDIILCPQMFRKIQSLSITFVDTVSDELVQLIHSQQNLKHLELNTQFDMNWPIILPTFESALKKHYHTLTKLYIYGCETPISFISSCYNLQELVISIFPIFPTESQPPSDVFDELQLATFPNLKIFKIPYDIPKIEILIKFLEMNGKNLNELRTGLDHADNSLNRSIAQFCPNLKKLTLNFENDEIDSLKYIFAHCQSLESIIIWCKDNRLNGVDLFEVVVKHSPKNFCELKIDLDFLFLPKDLEVFFTSWWDRTPRKSLNLVIFKNNFNSGKCKVSKENIKIIKRYKKLGILKEFEITDLYELE
ncbi:1676_t:CDS:1 [Funneliformis geosporum]|uniref:1676_t:CDS:1 n=1 Tax=Funneliformis geosporum TaxID=1117311 RepID=A0A9W4WQH8_9GLOM|nr:1676_t:CDS:1 [Funneliformis geosporum]